jgi:hypothetical protein
MYVWPLKSVASLTYSKNPTINLLAQIPSVSVPELDKFSDSFSWIGDFAVENDGELVWPLRSALHTKQPAVKADGSETRMSRTT